MPEVSMDRLIGDNFKDFPFEGGCGSIHTQCRHVHEFPDILLVYVSRGQAEKNPKKVSTLGTINMDDVEYYILHVVALEQRVSRNKRVPHFVNYMPLQHTSPTSTLVRVCDDHVASTVTMVRPGHSPSPIVVPFIIWFQA